MLPVCWISAFAWTDGVCLHSPTAIWANVFLLILTGLVKIAFTAWIFGMMVCRMSRQATAALHDPFLGPSWYLPSDHCNWCMHRACCWVDHVRTLHCCSRGSSDMIRKARPVSSISGSVDILFVPARPHCTVCFAGFLCGHRCCRDARWSDQDDKYAF